MRQSRQSPPSRPFWWLVLSLPLLTGCALRLAPSLTGQVVDAETRAPIPGATVARVPRVRCYQIIQSSAYPVGAREVLTGPDGRYTFGVRVDYHPCLPMGWEADWVGFAAPGYAPTRLHGGTPAGPIALERRRFAVETRARHEGILSELDHFPGDPGPLWRAAVAAPLPGPLPPAPEAPGVFARVPGAALTDVVVLDRSTAHVEDTLVLARDRLTGAVHGWRADGTPATPDLAAPAGWARLGADRGLGYPLLVQEGTLWHPAQVAQVFRTGNWPRWDPARAPWTTLPLPGPGGPGPVAVMAQIVAVASAGDTLVTYTADDGDERRYAPLQFGPGVSHPVAQVLPHGRAPIECLAAGPYNRSVLVVAHTAEGRAVYLWPEVRFLGRHLAARADRVPVPAFRLQAPVTACAATASAPQPTLFLAVEGLGVLRLTLRSTVEHEAQTWILTETRWLTPPGLPRTLTGLAVASFRTAGDLLYAVADGEVVYRVGPDGQLDQRLGLAASDRGLRP